MVELLRNTGKKVDKGKNQVWECRCLVCGKVFEARKCDAKKMKSCGCAKGKKSIVWIRDYTGERINYLEVLCFLRVEKGLSTWRVKCHLCAGECERSSGQLCKKPLSCGCYNPGPPRRYYPGVRVNDLEVLEEIRCRDDGHYVFRVLCHNCGNISEKPTYALGKNPRSCGCRIGENRCFRRQCMSRRSRS